jgi:adenylate kinase
MRTGAYFRTFPATMSSSSAKAPVIVITGTPGTGKSTTAELLAQESPVPLRHINVGDFIKQKNLHEGLDAEWQSYTVDEDKV